MALSPTDIELNCNQGLKIADGLSQAASEMEAQLSSYEGIASDIQSSWTGANANKFQGKMSDLSAKISTQITMLHDLEGAIRQTVAVYRQEQMSLYQKEQQEKAERARQKAESKKSSGGGGSHRF